MVDAFLHNSPCTKSHTTPCVNGGGGDGRLSPHTTHLLPDMALLHLALWINSLKAKSTLSGGKVGGGGSILGRMMVAIEELQVTSQDGESLCAGI